MQQQPAILTLSSARHEHTPRCPSTLHLRSPAHQAAHRVTLQCGRDLWRTSRRVPQRAQRSFARSACLLLLPRIPVLTRAAVHPARACSAVTVVRR